jgi:hypothetical protein
MNSKNPVNAVTASLKAKHGRRPSSKLTVDEAATEIAQALNIHRDAAAMTLYGLCATGNVRWLDSGGEVIDEDKCTIADFNHKPVHVIADDVRHFLTQWSKAPQPSRREAVIEAMIAEGLIPTRKIDWKSFCNRVRDKCNAHLDAKGRAPLGFSDKQIQRIYNGLMGK